MLASMSSMQANDAVVYVIGKAGSSSAAFSSLAMTARNSGAYRSTLNTSRASSGDPTCFSISLPGLSLAAREVLVFLHMRMFSDLRPPSWRSYRGRCR